MFYLNGNSGDLQIHSNIRKIETEEIHRTLGVGCPNNSHQSDIKLEQIKTEKLRWFENVLNSIQSHSQMSLLNKLLAPIEPTLNAAAAVPAASFCSVEWQIVVS